MTEGAKAIAARAEEALKGLVEELKKGHTEAFLRYLRTMSRFHRYSLRNTLLIWTQKPEATLVAGLRTWNEMGRYVRKGEKGIYILAPITKKVVEEDETGQEVEAEKVVGFRSAVVFDVSQTEGKPLPHPPANGKGPKGLYQKLVSACPFPVMEAPLGQRYGETDGQTIRINKELSEGEKAATLLHEWAHALLHFGEEPPLPPTLRELEAEATAYAVGRSLGLEMTTSRDYILGWAGHEAEEALRHLFPRILKATATLAQRVHTAKEPGLQPA